MNTQSQPMFIIEDEFENKLNTYENDNDEVETILEIDSDDVYFVRGYN
jgi:hypothetical protein